MNINEVHWNFSDNGTKELAKSRFWNFYNFWTAWNFWMRFSLLCSGEWALSFYICVFIYIGVSLTLYNCCFVGKWDIPADRYSEWLCKRMAEYLQYSEGIPGTELYRGQPEGYQTGRITIMNLKSVHIQYSKVLVLTVNFLNIRTPKNFVVITLKVELCGSTIE